jgi:phage tail sheath protein FI
MHQTPPNNVRSLLNTAQQQIEHLLQPYLFSVNDHQTRQMVAKTVDNYMRSLNTNVYDWRVVCDATNNTQRDISNGMLKLDVLVQPTGSINYFNINASLGSDTFYYDYKTYL